jgi:hypothetical protein
LLIFLFLHRAIIRPEINEENLEIFSLLTFGLSRNTYQNKINTWKVLCWTAVVSVLVCLSRKGMFHQSKQRTISEEKRFRLDRCVSLKSRKTAVAKKNHNVLALHVEKGDDVIPRVFSIINYCSGQQPVISR